MTNEQKDKILFVSAITLVVIHLAGIIGINTAYKDLFLTLTPINLLISAFLLFLNHRDYNKSFYIFCIVIFSIGYLVEVIGVSTGIIFGNYSYGKTLGFKLLDVPVIIGINWLILVYCIGVIFNKLNLPILLKSLIGASLLVVLDFFIEKVAIKYDFWSWSQTNVPLQNYIAWFILSFILLLIFNLFRFKTENRMAQSLFIIQLVFFVTLAFF